MKNKASFDQSFEVAKSSCFFFAAHAAVGLINEQSIAIAQSKDSQNYKFEKFALDTSGIGRFKANEQQILIQHLCTAESEQLQSDRISFEEVLPEDYIISVLIDFNDISYYDHFDILYGSCEPDGGAFMFLF